MGIPGRSLNLGMTKQFADHRQPFANEQPAGRKCVAEIVNAYVAQSRSFPDATPRMLKIGQVRFLPFSNDDVRVAVYARPRLQQRNYRLAKMNGLCPSHAIG